MILSREKTRSHEAELGERAKVMQQPPTKILFAYIGLSCFQVSGCETTRVLMLSFHLPRLLNGSRAAFLLLWLSLCLDITHPSSLERSGECRGSDVIAQRVCIFVCNVRSNCNVRSYCNVLTNM